MLREVRHPSDEDDQFHVLTVAGSDSNSGAGACIQADLKVCAARGIYCSTVITAVTAQNTVGVQGVSIVDQDFVGEQLKSVLSDMFPDVASLCENSYTSFTRIVKILSQSLKEFRVGALDYRRDIHIGGHQGPFDHLMKLKNNAMNLHVHRRIPFDPGDLLLYAVTDSRMNQK